MTPDIPSCRLFLLLARSAQRAVIFRRGPTKWFQLILWHTDTDQIDYGQWFKGKIFIDRSDLSPDGTRLIYFALMKNPRTIQDTEFQYSHGTYSWTAISKPPFYTALALWPKGGSWYGGGLFESDHAVFLNHSPETAEPHPEHIPHELEIIPNPEAEQEHRLPPLFDNPIYRKRLARDGWQVEQEWQGSSKGFPAGYSTEIPEIRVRLHPYKPYRVVMKRWCDHWIVREIFLVENFDLQPVVDVEGSDWVDWDQNGRLIVLKQGKVWIGIEAGCEFIMTQLIDLNPQQPKLITSPAWAREW